MVALETAMDVETLKIAIDVKLDLLFFSSISVKHNGSLKAK